MVGRSEYIQIFLDLLEDIPTLIFIFIVRVTEPYGKRYFIESTNKKNIYRVHLHLVVEYVNLFDLFSRDKMN